MFILMIGNQQYSFQNICRVQKYSQKLIPFQMKMSSLLLLRRYSSDPLTGLSFALPLTLTLTVNAKAINKFTTALSYKLSSNDILHGVSLKALNEYIHDTRDSMMMRLMIPEKDCKIYFSGGNMRSPFSFGSEIVGD